MTPTGARLALVVGTAAWGLTFTANHRLLEVLPPEHITVLRFLLVSLILLTVVASRPALRPRLAGRDWLLVAVCGVLAVPGAQLALTHGQRFLSPAMSGLVVAAGPAFAAVLAALFLAERLIRRSWVGIAIAFAGAALIIVATSGDDGLTVRNPVGAALVGAAQLAWAGYTVLSKQLVIRLHPITLVTLAVVAGTLAMVPALPGALRATGSLEPVHWLWLAHLVVLGTVVPYLVWSLALRLLPANETAVFMFLVPLFALAWSTLLVGERPATIGLVGGLAILVGVALTQSAQHPLRLPGRWARPAR